MSPQQNTAAPQNGAHAPSATDTPMPAPAWTIPQVAALVGMIGVTAGGLGSFAAASFARGEAAKRLDVVEEAVRAHGIVLEKHGADAVRLAVVEANVAAIREGVQRIEQTMRDDRAERRSNGGVR